MKIKLVDLAKSKFIIEPRYYFWGWSKSPKILGRASLAKALVKARRFLPKDYNFKVWDCQRPRYVQILMLESFIRRFKAAHPTWSKAKLEKTLYTFGARPTMRVTKPHTHRLGGAIDLTIVDRDGNELWMGTDHDDLSDRAALDHFETGKPKDVLDREARKNRRLLKKVMLKAGFRIYPPEWWHWMYDR